MKTWLSRLMMGVICLGFASPNQVCGQLPSKLVYVNQKGTNSNQDGKTWATAYHELRDALATGIQGDYWVTSGTYKPTADNDRSKSFTPPSYAVIRGGFLGTEKLDTQRQFAPNHFPVYQTVLSGDIGTPATNAVTAQTVLTNVTALSFDPADPGFKDNSYHVIRTSGFVILDGLIIANGNADPGTNTAAGGIDSGLIELMNVPDPQSKNFPGPGFALRNLDSRVAGGGMLVANLDPGFYNFANHPGFPEISDADGDATVQNCLFINNQAMGMGGAAACYDSQMIFQNTLFWLNASGYSGGAFWGFNQISLFTDCEFFGNAAIRSGGAVQCVTMPGHDSLTYPFFDTNAIASAAAYVGQVIYGEDVQIAEVQKTHGGDGLGGLLGNSGEAKLSTNTRLVFSELAAKFTLKYGFRVATGLKNDVSTVLGGVEAKQLLAAATGLEEDTCGEIFLAIGIVAVAGRAADALAIYLGADPNNPWIQGTSILFTVMSDYNNPINILLDLAKLLAGAFASPGPTYEQQAGGMWRANQELFNNNHEPTLFYNCQFRNNTSAGMGGALMACYDNVFIEHSLFQSNVALTMGGALAFSGYAQPLLINDAFVGNSSGLEASAIVHSFQTEARIINCTIVSNTIFGSARGAAIANETGANVVIGNSILWGNTVSNGSPGIDVFTSKVNNLSPSQYANYDSAHNSHWQWVAVCDIRNSNLQSLQQMEVGHGDFADLYGNASSVPLFGDNTATYATGYVLDQTGFPQPSGAEQGFSFQTWDYEQVSGAPNVGEGNRETMLKPAYGNISVDPHLSPLLGSFPNSPGVGKGNPSLAFNRNVSAVSRTDLLGQPFTGKDMGATENSGSYPPGVIYYVNQLVAGGNHDGSSWANAATTISTKYIASQDSIWVAAGTYTGNYVLPAGVSIYGGFAGGETNVSQSNPTLHPTMIRPAYATNALTSLGGGAVIHGLTFSNVSFSSGSALSVSGPATVQYCAFISNYAPSGALNASGSGVNLYQCNFTGNAGNNGALLSSAGSLLIRNCRFDLNQGSSAGGCYLTGGGNTEIWGTEFYQNSGGAIVSSQSSLKAQNCTLYGNTVTTPLQAGGITFTGGGSCSVLNTILYGNRVINQPPALEYQQINLASHSQIQNCIVQGLLSFPSVNSLDVSPQLQVQFSSFPLANSLVPIQALQIASLAPSSGLGASLAINSGAPSYDAGAFTPTDLAGQPRLTGSAIDIGAYEYQGAIPTVISNSTLALSAECGGGHRYLVLTASPAEPAYCPIRWQVNTGDGNGFTDLVVNTNTRLVTFGGTSYTSTNGSVGGGKVFPAQMLSGITTSQLTISNPPVSLNGYLFRLWCLGEQSNSAPALPEFITPAAAVSVLVDNPVLFVNAAATGNNDGSSWKDAFVNLHDGLERLPGGCGQIWVAGGTYFDGPFGVPSGAFLFGGFNGTETNLAQRNWQANPTILQTELPFHGSTVGIGNQAGLDGFMLRQFVPGPAMVVTDGTPMIQNCVFTPVSGNTYAAIINAGNPTFNNCQFLNWPQTALVNNSGAILQSCVFTGNSDSVNGGAITAGTGAGILARDCVFSGNSGGLAGGVSLLTGTNSTFLRCSFTGNTGITGPGALAIGTNTSVLDNCLFAANASLQGAGAVRYGGTNLLVIHCTLANNTALQRTAGLDSNAGANVTVWNSIFWGNQVTGSPATEAAQLNQVTSVIHNTIIQGLTVYAGNNNIPYAPLFLNDLAGNYRLNPSSPAINAGSASAPQASNPELDLTGNPRSYSATLPDAGCYEFQGINPGRLNLLSVPTATGTCGGSGAEIQLTAVAPAGSNYTYQWYALSGSTAVLITNGGNFQILQSGSSNLLNILNAEQYFAQQFQLVVNGSTTLAPATVTLSTPSVIYVNAAVATSGNGTSWGSAFKTIQSAVAVAGSCTEIWVAKGKYLCGTGLALQDGALILGGFAGIETSRSQRNPTNNVSYLVPSTVNGPMVSAINLPGNLFLGRGVLDGFYLTGNGVSTSQPAVAISNAAPIIRNCTFGTNVLGASVMQASGALFDSCVFTYNTGTSLAILSSSNLQAVNCRFINGKGLAGVTLTNSTAQLTGCYFISNQVAASQTILSSQSTLTVEDCILSGNSGFSALAAYGGTVNLNDSEISGNTGTTNSSAIYGNSTALNLLNDTIAYNRAGGLTGGLWVNGGSVSISNTILWQNTTTQNNRVVEQAQMFLAPANQVFANCIIQGLDLYTNAGPGLVPFDPVFVNPAGGNYQLTSVSPAVGAGATAGISSTVVDPLGNLRLHGGVADIGAYAFTGAATLPSYLNYFLANESVCRFGDTTFFVNDQSGQPLTVTWQVNAGTGFTNVVNDAFDTISSTPTGSSLRLYPVPSNYNGRLYRFLAAGQVNFTSPVVTLTINAQAIRYVDSQALGANNGTSWANAFTSLATAIGSSSACNALWVAAGTYNVSGVELPPGLEIDGGFTNGAPSLSARDPVAHPTVISTPGSALNHSTAEAVGQHTILDGLTFRNNATLVINPNGGSPLIRNCTFVQSLLSTFPGSSAIASNTTFTGGTPIQLTGGRFSMSQCVVSNCTGGIYTGPGSYLSATACQFVNNASSTGAGVVELNSGASFQACAFLGNSGSTAGAVTQSGNPVIFQDCLFTRNSGSVGAIFGRQPFTAVNCTIVTNTSSEAGGIVNNSHAPVTLRNCILWGNVATGFSDPLASQIFAAYSDGGFSLANNIVQFNAGVSGFDPRLNANYTLPIDSPAVNAGNNAFTLAGETDLAGNARIEGGTVDLGAYEVSAYLGTNGATYGPPPQPVTACQGGMAAFQASGLATYNFQWQYNFGPGWTNFNVGSWLGASVMFLTNGGVSTLQLTGIGTNLDQLSVRAAFVGTSYLTPAARLTVIPTPFIYVDASRPTNGNGSSWAAAFNNLPDALTAAFQSPACAPVIEVARGTYTNAGTFNIRAQTTVYGGFPNGGGTLASRNWQANPTILSNAPNLGTVVTINSPSGPDTVLDGLIIHGGAIGIHTLNSGPTLRNLIVRRAFSNHGGGIMAEFPTAGMLISNCIISNNVTGIIGHDGSLSVVDCGFYSNGSANGIDYGGGIYAASTLTNGSWTFQRCVFSGNLASRGGSAAWVNYPTTFRDCLFAKNITTTGGGVILADSPNPTVLINCTVASNTATFGSGIGIDTYRDGNYLTIENSIVWGNQGTSIYASIGNPSGANNLIQGGSGGPFQNVNPLLNADYTLPATSPAINSGLNSLILPGETDLAGNPRVQSAIVDLGAYESPYNGSSSAVHGAAPASVTACPGSGASFQTTGLPYYSFQWQYGFGAGWTNVTDGASIGGAATSVTTVNGVSTLSFAGVTTNLNNLQVQAVYVGQSYTTSVAVLTVPSAATLYVDQSVTPGGNGSSWATAYRDLGFALSQGANVSCGSANILVAQGNYTTTSNFVVSPHLAVYGGFSAGGGSRDWQAYPTILNGSSNVIRIVPGATNDCLIDGFMVRGGAKYGIVVSNAAPSLQNLVLSGAGLAAILAQNSAGGLVISNCFFTNNLSPGNGAAINATNSIFSVLACNFANNRAANGGAVYLNNGALTARNSLFTGNVSTNQGGAILNAGGTVTLVNCTVADNTGGTYAGGLGQTGGSATLLNSIFWGNNVTSLSSSNTPSANLYAAQGNLNLTNDIVEFQSSPAGVNLLNFNPFFTPGYALAPNSPAINAGTNAYVLGNETDLAGNPRVQNSVVDLGAYESMSAGANTLYAGPPPLPVSTCPGSTATFQASGLDSYDIVWQYNLGSGWTNFPSGDWLYGGSVSVAFTGGISTLNLSGFSTNLSSLQVQAVYSGLGYTSVVATVTVPVTILYVDAAATGGDGTSWAGAYRDLAPALFTAAQSACGSIEIRVASGTYPTVSGYQLPANVIVYGGFVSGADPASRDPLANPTILVGSPGATVATITGQGGVLDGFILTGASSGIVASNANPVVRNCQIIGHTGIGVSLTGGSGSFTNCVFQGNASGAIYATNCELVLANALVTGNGGGLALFQGTGTLINTTVAGNEEVLPVSAFLGGIHSQGTDLTIFNSILWYNRSAQPNPGSTEAQQLALSFAGATIANTSIEGLVAFSGPGVTGQTPVFVLPLDPSQAPTTNGDYRLATCSPLIGAGNEAFASELTLDLVGNLRVSGVGIDLGPFEFTGAPATSMSILAQPRDLVFPNPGANFFALSAFGDGLTYDWQIALAGSPSSFASLASVPGFVHANLPLLLVHQPGATFNGAQVRCRITSSEGCVVWTRAAVLTVNPTVLGTGGALLNAAIVNDGVVQLTFSGVAGAGYVMQRATSLAGFPVLWTDVSTNLTDGEGLFIFQDLQATNFTTKFYRTRTP